MYGVNWKAEKHAPEKQENRNNQSKNKFPNYKKYRFIQKHTKKFKISCWIRNEKYRFTRTYSGKMQSTDPVHEGNQVYMK